MLAEILFRLKTFFQPSMFVCFVCLYVWIVSRSVCRVCFTCMLNNLYVLGVRMFVASVAACFAYYFCDAD